ncbi:hypothetical protein ES703_85352 [subsurface metagenome]
MRISKQALAFLKYLYGEGATHTNEDPDCYRKISGFLLAESDEHFIPGTRARLVMKMGARYNSIQRTVQKLHQDGYLTRRTRGRVHGYDYRLAEKGTMTLHERGVID